MNIFAQPEEIRPSDRVVNAASRGRLEDLREALAAGGDPNFVRLHISPTLICAMRDYNDCLQLLVDSGARSDLPTQVGWTALHEAARKEDPQCLTIILSKPENTNVRCRDDEGRTALFGALQQGRFDNADALLAVEPDLIHLNDAQDVSPVLFAIQEKNIDMLNWCLNNGANLVDKDCGDAIAQGLKEWNEGMSLVSLLRGDQALSAPAPSSSSSASSQAPESKPAEEEAVANPFGLGGIKKRRA